MRWGITLSLPTSRKSSAEKKAIEAAKEAVCHLSRETINGLREAARPLEGSLHSDLKESGLGQQAARREVRDGTGPPCRPTRRSGKDRRPRGEGAQVGDGQNLSSSRNRTMRHSERADLCIPLEPHSSASLEDIRVQSCGIGRPISRPSVETKSAREKLGNARRAQRESHLQSSNRSTDGMKDVAPR